MALFPLLSFFTAYSFLLMSLYILKLNRKEPLNRLAALVDFCFAVWAFAYTFFYQAPTAEQALFWHKVSALGWIPVGVLGAHFFLQLTGTVRHWRIAHYALFYAPALILLVHSLFAPGETAVVKDLVPSLSGWGWTYIPNLASPWFWLYILYISAYYGVALSLTYAWAKRSNRLRFMKQAKSIIALDVVAIVLGFCVELLLPAITPALPPIFNLLSIVWGVGLLYIIKTYKLMSVFEAAIPDLILATVMDPIILLDKDGLIQKCNQATLELLRYPEHQILHKPFVDFLAAKKYNEQRLALLWQKKALRDIEIDLIDAEGRVIYGLAALAVAESRLDGIVGIVINLHDMTRYKKKSDALKKMANYDKLTNLPNRRLLLSKVGVFLAEYKRSGTRFDLAFIDLDGFKPVNDTYGHETGDLLLVEVAKILSGAVREQDFIARIGGDEFVIIFASIKASSELSSFIQRIKQRFAAPIDIQGRLCRIGVSVGISRCPEDGVSLKALMQAADRRMYGEKFSRRSPDDGLVRDLLE